MTFKFTPIVEEEDQKSSSFKFTPVQEPETAGFLESMGISLGESLKGARRAVDAVRVLGNELPSAQRQFHPSTVPTNDQIFTEQKSLEDYIDSVVNPDKKRAHWTGQLAAGVPTMLLNLASSPFTTGQTFLDQGESLGRAGVAAGIDTAMNAAGVALPIFGPMRNAGKLVGAATGAGANIAQDVASRSMIQAVAEKENTKKIFENTPETIALAGITGGVFGGAAVPSRKANAKAKTDIDNLRTKIAEKEAAEKAAKEAPSTPTEPTFMSPSQLLDWMGQVEKSRALHSMERRGGRPDVDLSDGNPVVRANEPDTRITETGGDVPIRVDSGGNAFYPTADAVAARDRASAEMAREQLDIWARENPDEWAALARDNPQAVAEVFAKLEAEIAAKKAADEEAAWQQRGPEIERKAAEAQRARDNEDALAAAENEAKANDLRQKYKNKHDVDPEDLRKVIAHAMTLRHGNVTPNGLRDTVLSILNAPHLRQTVLDIINGEGTTLQPRSINGAELTSIVHRVSREAGQRQQQSETPSRLRNLVDRILYPPVTMNTGGMGRKQRGAIHPDLLTLGIPGLINLFNKHKITGPKFIADVARLRAALDKISLHNHEVREEIEFAMGAGHPGPWRAAMQTAEAAKYPQEIIDILYDVNKSIEAHADAQRFKNLSFEQRKTITDAVRAVENHRKALQQLDAEMDTLPERYSGATKSEQYKMRKILAARQELENDAISNIGWAVERLTDLHGATDTSLLFAAKDLDPAFVQKYQSLGESQASNNVVPLSRTMGKQSGRVDFQGISDSLSKAAERIANAFKSQKTPSDHILKLTGVDLIKKGPTADEMLARQAAAGPVPEANFWMNWNSGLSMLADKFPKVPLIKDMNQWLRYVHRKIAKSDREVRQPLERLAVQLGKDSQVKMALIAKSESLRKQYYTDAEYAEFGLNPREIKFMRSVQEAHRISNELQSTSAIEALGKGVREQAGYYTHDFSGPVKITATIIGKDGKPTTYRTREDSMAKAKKAEAWLKANRGATDITIEQLHTNYDHNRSHDRTRSSLEALIEIHQGNEDKVSIVKDILSDLERARAEGVGGHDQHLYDKKTFAEGYSGDRPWRSDVENATDWWQKQINMTSETARWAAINEMMAEYKKVMADPEVQKMGKFKDVINEYVLQEMGMRSSTWKAFEEKSMQALMNYMPEKLGKGDVAALKDFFANMKSLAYIKALSASAGYTLVTPIQVIGMGLPEYGRLLANGEVRLKDGTPFIMDVMDGVMMGTFEAKNTVFSANQKMWEFFMENDVVPRRVVDDYKNINSNQGVDLTMSTLNFMIAKPDQMARAAAAFAFGKALERGGKYATPEEAWARAAEITSKVAMPITKQDRPLIVDSAGQVGNLAFFLHTPLFATWNAANIFVRNIAQADTPSQKAKSAAAFAFFLAAMAASGGLGEMMGVNELSQLNDIALGGLSYTNPELYANAREINLTKQLLTIFPEHRILNEVLNYGAASTAFSMDLGSRFNQGVGDLSKPLESVTGVPGIMKDMFVDPPIGAVQSFMEGSTRPFTQDLANALPPLGRGILQSDNKDFKSAVQPDEEAYPGYANYRKFGDYKDTSINVTRSPREQELGRFGLRSLEEGKKLRIDRLTKAEAQRDQRAIASLNEDLSYSLLTKNPENFERKLSALLKLDPLAVDNSISNVVQKIEESGLTQSQKDALKARTMLAYKRVQDNQRLKNATQSSGN